VAKDNKKKKTEENEERVEVEAQEQPEPEDVIASSEEELPELQEGDADDELSQLKSQAAEYLDGWQRARAEFANYKKRVERENEGARQRITAEMLLRYLDIMDDLERALENSPDKNDMHEWISGIELIYQKFSAILESEGVEPIETEGERFDPNLHEAISYEDTDEFEGGSIIAVTQRGYKLGDRIVRPAMVRVAK
jgi:molecular chaperone GrpE